MTTDQGVMGGILTLPEFLGYFEQINPDAPGLTPHESSMRSTYQGISVASYNLGCFIGAIITIFIGNPSSQQNRQYIINIDYHHNRTTPNTTKFTPPTTGGLKHLQNPRPTQPPSHHFPKQRHGSLFYQDLIKLGISSLHSSFPSVSH